MPLKLSLRDGERIVVNGTVMRPVGRTIIMIETHGQILRGRDLMEREAAVTPCSRLYYHTMMAYIDPDNLELHRTMVIASLNEVIRAYPDAETLKKTAEFAERAAASQYYGALASCKALMEVHDGFSASGKLAAR